MEDFTNLTTEITVLLEELAEDMRKQAEGLHGAKAAGKRARKLMRKLKAPTTGLFARWIAASIERDKGE